MLKKNLTKLLGADLAIAGVTLGFLILITFINVMARYIVNRPIYWAEEFQVICLIIVVFFGAGAGFRVGSHVAIDFVVELFSPKMQKITAILIYLIFVALMLYFFVQSSVFVRQMFATERVTNILRIPLFVVYSAFPIGCILIIINYTIATYLRYIKTGKEEGSR